MSHSYQIAIFTVYILFSSVGNLQENNGTFEQP